MLIDQILEINASFFFLKKKRQIIYLGKMVFEILSINFNKN